MIGVLLTFALLGLLGVSIDRRPLIDCAPTVLAWVSIVVRRDMQAWKPP